MIVAAHSNIGNHRSVNEDSLCVKVARSDFGHYVMAVICDGMGGLSKGELASATVVEMFSGWFDSELPLLLHEEDFSQKVKDQWKDLIHKANHDIEQYGKRLNKMMGTTVSAMLFCKNEYYIIAHVGDSRIYQIDSRVLQLTEDQTVAAREVRSQRMTPEYAKNSPSQHVLLQCVGASSAVSPVFYEGTVKKGCSYLLCTDGFYHIPGEREWIDAFVRNEEWDEIRLHEQIVDVAESIVSRGETDNLSAIVVLA